MAPPWTTKISFTLPWSIISYDCPKHGIKAKTHSILVMDGKPTSRGILKKIHKRKNICSKLYQLFRFVKVHQFAKYWHVSLRIWLQFFIEGWKYSLCPAYWEAKMQEKILVSQYVNKYFMPHHVFYFIF